MDGESYERVTSPIRIMMIGTSFTVAVVLLLSFLDSGMFTQQEDIFMRIDLNKDSFFATNAKEKYFIVIMIPTLPKNFKTRATIRATWGNISALNNISDIPEQYRRVKFMFVVGQYRNKEYEPEFLEEMGRENDIFVCNGIDEHRTVLKYKVLWGMMRSIELYDYTYFIKTDDDILGNMPTILRMLRGMPHTKFYTGACGRVYGGFSNYPRWRYCSGGGYILSHDLIEQITALDPKIHRVQFRPEDAYSGYLVYKANEVNNIDVQPVSNSNSLKLGPYQCGPWHHWFYHRERQPEHMIEQFNMMNNNITIDCPES